MLGVKGAALEVEGLLQLAADDLGVLGVLVECQLLADRVGPEGDGVHPVDALGPGQLAKRCNEKRVMAESVKWGEKGTRVNSISPGIIVTPLALDEFNGPRGDFYKNMFAKCPAGRPGTADEVANVAELLMSDKGAFITGAGATTSYFYTPSSPKPEP